MSNKRNLFELKLTGYPPICRIKKCNNIFIPLFKPFDTGYANYILYIILYNFTKLNYN